jgi:hypothetical protein
MSSIESNTSTRTVRDLVLRKKNGRISTPKHQRNATVWDEKRRKEFIDTVKRYLPFPSILLYLDDYGVEWLEDGLQRLTTLESFVDDKFTDKEGNHFSQWSELERQMFLKYNVPVLSYSGANQAERVKIFDRFQNGVPLRVGERLHALSYTPLVSTTMRMLLKFENDAGETVNGEFYERAMNVWGSIKFGEDDKRRNDLCMFVALMNGVINGFPRTTDGDYEGGISKKYLDLEPYLFEEPDLDKVRKILETLLNIYEDVDNICARGAKFTRLQKDVGVFTGAIVYSLKTYDDWERLHIGWVNFIAKCREDSAPLKSITEAIGPARSWNVRRWKTIYRIAFNLADSGEESVHSEYDEYDE